MRCVTDQHTHVGGESSLTPTTRLAPSPTGALHLGNARTFLVNWALARQRGWRIVLRIEDLDTPRNKPGAIDQALDDLRWIGIDWDEGPIIQSADLEPHRRAMRILAGRALAYPCELSRSQIEEAASAPQESASTNSPVGPSPAPTMSGHETRFPPELRPPIIPRDFEDGGANWRFVTPARDVSIDDEFAGLRAFRPSESIGDYVIWTNRRQPAYQLAVVVDDARQQVTHIVRGDDLLESAARQVLLYEALELGGPPRYCHVPLVRGADGRRLAKRHGDTRINRYREAGVRPERVIGLMTQWCGIAAARTELSPGEFRDSFELGKMPRGDITFTPEDNAWLMGLA